MNSFDDSNCYLRKIPIILIVIFAFISVFGLERDAIKKETQYKQLANGWVSFYPEVFIDNKLNTYEKFEKIVSADLDHGRLRPAFAPYASSGYFLSPILHNRLGELNEQRYGKLITGDLRIFTMILLGSVAVSMIFVSVLIYRYTGIYIYSVIPMFFIPLSPSLTENLVQNYIDSQEIPLLLWLTAWFFFYHLLLLNFIRNKVVLVFFQISSLIALLLFFLTKETSIVMTGVMTIHLLLAIVSKKIEVPDNCQIKRKTIVFTSLVSFVMTVLILIITMTHKTGYATAYTFDASTLALVIIKLWICISTYSLVSLYTAALIGFVLCFLFIKRNTRINGIAAIHHIFLFFSFVLLMTGLWVILVPWNPILTKYTFPSVFLYTFLFCYTLSLIHAYLKNWNGVIAKCFSVLVFGSMIYLYAHYFNDAESARKFTYNQANYGISVIPEIVADINSELRQKPGNEKKVLVNWQAGSPWRNGVVGSKLHMQRWLNIRYGINIVKENLNIVRHYSMPENETTSFRFNSSAKNLFLTENKKALKNFKFDIVYMGYLVNEKPEEIIETEQGNYSLTDKKFDYRIRNKHSLREFSVYKYLPFHQ